LPSNLIFAGARIQVRLEETVPVSRTASAIVIQGNRAGFLSLANCLIFLSNALEDPIRFPALPFVSDEVRLQIEFDEAVTEVHGVLVRECDRTIWKLSELNSDSIFCAMHSLGNLNSELHLDVERSPSDLSVYCVVIDD
jgi:hypothetical protein